MLQDMGMFDFKLEATIATLMPDLPQARDTMWSKLLSKYI